MGRIFDFIGLVVGVFVVFIVFGLLLSSVRIVDAGEVGVKTEFGRVVEVLHPSIYFVIPVMNDVKYMSTQIEKFETAAGAASKDLQVVNTQIAINYRISEDDAEVMELYETFRGRHEQRIIAPLVQEVVKANTAKFNAAELITKRVEVKSQIASDLESKLASYGLEVAEVSITDLSFSPEFDAAIEAKVVAEQKLQKETIDLETKKIEVQKMVAEKNASATALLIQAEAEAKATVIRADAEAEAITKITESVTEPYLGYYYLERWDGKLPLVLGEKDMMIDLQDLNKAD